MLGYQCLQYRTYFLRCLGPSIIFEIRCHLYQIFDGDVTQALRRLISSATRLLLQNRIQTNKKETINALNYTRRHHEIVSCCLSFDWNIIGYHSKCLGHISNSNSNKFYWAHVQKYIHWKVSFWNSLEVLLSLCMMEMNSTLQINVSWYWLLVFEVCWMVHKNHLIICLATIQVMDMSMSLEIIFKDLR